MSLSAHMVIKNGIKFDYPFIESCLSVLDICDEFIFIEGESDDGTYEKLMDLSKSTNKIKVFQMPWTKIHYSVLADLTNYAIERCSCEYHLQIQADEVIHEMYLPKIKEITNGKCDFCFFGVLHFYSGFSKVYKPGVYYDKFIRMAKRSLYPRVRSYGDAMTLGCPDSDSSQLKSVDVTGGVKVFHYGYVRKPKKLIEKQKDFTKLYGINELDKYLENGEKTRKIDWQEKHKENDLRGFAYTHPAVLKNWIDERKEDVESGKVEET